MSTLKLADLAIEHDYHGATENYYSREARVEFPHWKEFINGMGQSDEDLNLVFRWDISKDDNGVYYMDLMAMQQRKGKFVPISIAVVLEEDVDSIVEFLGRHWAKLQRLWCPLSIPDLSQVPDPVQVRYERSKR